MLISEEPLECITSYSTQLNIFTWEGNGLTLQEYIYIYIYIYIDGRFLWNLATPGSLLTWSAPSTTRWLGTVLSCGEATTPSKKSRRIKIGSVINLMLFKPFLTHLLRSADSNSDKGIYFKKRTARSLCNSNRQINREITNFCLKNPLHCWLYP